MREVIPYSNIVFCVPPQTWKGIAIHELMQRYYARLGIMLRYSKPAIITDNEYAKSLFRIMGIDVTIIELPIPKEGTPEYETLIGTLPNGTRGIIDTILYTSIADKLYLIRKITSDILNIQNTICSTCEYMKINIPTLPEQIKTETENDMEKICKLCNENTLSLLLKYPHYIAVKEEVITTDEQNPVETRWFRYEAFEWVEMIYMRKNSYDIFYTNNPKAVQYIMLEPMSTTLTYINALPPQTTIEFVIASMAKQLMKVYNTYASMITDVSEYMRKYSILLTAVLKLLTCINMEEAELREITRSISCKPIPKEKIINVLRDIMELINEGEVGLAYEVAEAYEKEWSS